MKLSILFFLSVLFYLALLTAFTNSTTLQADDIDLFVCAGQSNMQGWQGNGAYYPADPDNLDSQIKLYWVYPATKTDETATSSEAQWTTLKPQNGRFPDGHFGPEVTFARKLKKSGFNPAIFKYSDGGTSLGGDWKAPGSGGMYDAMVTEFKKAVDLLKSQGHNVIFRGLVWIQGESDGEYTVLRDAYEDNLKILINDFRNNVIEVDSLPVILGVDEQHLFVTWDPDKIVGAQERIAESDPKIIFTSMIGLQKADSTHLTPDGLLEHGDRLYNDAMSAGIFSDQTDLPPTASDDNYSAAQDSVLSIKAPGVLINDSNPTTETSDAWINKADLTRTPYQPNPKN